MSLNTVTDVSCGTLSHFRYFPFFFSLLLPRTDVCNYRAILAVYEQFQHTNGHSYPQACAVAIYGFTYIPLPISVAAPSKAWVCGSLLAGTAGSNPTRGVDVCCECCVLSGRGLCIGLITRPEES